MNKFIDFLTKLSIPIIMALLFGIFNVNNRLSALEYRSETIKQENISANKEIEDIKKDISEIKLILKEIEMTQKLLLINNEKEKE